MNKLYQKARLFAPRQNEGFTLVELMVVVAILGILGAATVTLISSIFESNVRSQQRLDQQTRVETLYGFLASRMATARRPIGLKKTSGCANGQSTCIDPLTIAGDQLVFESGGVCYRIYYKKSEQKIYGVATGQDCSSIAPTRGPNETNYGTRDNDPVLDAASGSATSPFILAEKIQSERPSVAGTGFPNPLQIFTYLDENNKITTSSNNKPPNTYACTGTSTIPDPTGGTGTVGCTVSDWYNVFSNRAEIMSTDFTAYIAPTIESPKVAPLAYQQNMSFQQVCSDPTQSGSGTTPGTVVTPSKTTYGQVGTGAITSSFAEVKTSSTDDLVSGSINSQDAFLNYSGQVTVTLKSGLTPSVPASSSFTGIQVKVELYRKPNNSSSEAVVNDSSSATGVSEQLFSLGAPLLNTSAEQSIPLEGRFKLPKTSSSGSSTDDPGDTYRVKVFIKGDSNYQYSRTPNKLWLDYEAVAW